MYVALCVGMLCLLWGVADVKLFGPCNGHEVIIVESCSCHSVEPGPTPTETPTPLNHLRLGPIKKKCGQLKFK